MAGLDHAAAKVFIENFKDKPTTVGGKFQPGEWSPGAPSGGTAAEEKKFTPDEWKP